MTLQNAYGDREFPVRARWRWRKVVATARRRRNSTADKAVILGLAFGIVAVIFGALWVMGTLTGGDFTTFLDDDNTIGKLGAALLVVMVLTLVVSWIVAFGDGGLPRREQRKYQRLARSVPLTERQAQILALDAISDFSIGGWNRSLAFLPVWNAMPQSMQAKHEKIANYQPFLSFELKSLDSMRNFMDQSQSIVSTADAERHLERAMGEDSLSLKFVDMLSNPEATDAVQRLASLTGTTDADLRALGTAPAGSPAPLLWAADVMFAVGFVRNAYLSEYLEEERAWEHLEQLAKVAFAIFPSSEKYWANARIGLTFINNSREAVQKFDLTYRDLKASRWPAAQEDFPHDKVGDIPDVVRNLRAKSSLSD